MAGIPRGRGIRERVNANGAPTSRFPLSLPLNISHAGQLKMSNLESRSFIFVCASSLQIVIAHHYPADYLLLHVFKRCLSGFQWSIKSDSHLFRAISSTSDKRK